MKFHQSSVVLLTLWIYSAAGSGFGKCPKYPSMPKFDMKRVLGQWYEVERSFYLPEIVSGCTTLTFKPGMDSQKRLKKLEVAIQSINTITGNPSYNAGYATPENRGSSIMDFKFNTRIPDVIARLLPGTGQYQILYTDYDDFAILWSCSSLASLGYTDQIWVFGRNKDFPAEVRVKIYDALKKLGLDHHRLILSKNKNCPDDE